MIYTTIDTVSQFRDEFRKYDRQGQFTYGGFELLWDYLENMGQDYELDVIALCCEFAEETPEQIAADYRLDVSGLSDDALREEVLTELHNATLVLGETKDGTIVFASF
jgi:hypothetical protein